MDEKNLRKIWRRQYDAAFTMLANAIELCPDELWSERTEEAAFWQQILHTLAATEFYFNDQPIPIAHPLVLRLAGMDEPPATMAEARSMRDKIHLMSRDWQPPFEVSREELQTYLGQVRVRCNEIVAVASLADGEPGSEFPWCGQTVMDKFIYNLRHLQHHIGRLNSLLSRNGIANDWVYSGPTP